MGEKKIALAKYVESDPRSLEAFVTTRTTLLRRVNEGDKKAFEEFYNLYCPAMLKYLGLNDGSQKEKDQWDFVHEVFLKLYKTFAMVEDPDTGAKRIPRNLLAVLSRKDKETGDVCNIKFRYYLVTCLKNAIIAKWRHDTKKGKMDVRSMDARIVPTEKTTWKDQIEDMGVNPKQLACADEEGERLSAVMGIWQAVIKGFLQDESLDDSVRDITYRSIAEDVSTDELSEYWGITKNNAYQIKHRSMEKAKRITKEIYRILDDDNDDIQGDVDRLYAAVSRMKPCKHIDKFMIALAKGLCR